MKIEMSELRNPVGIAAEGANVGGFPCGAVFVAIRIFAINLI